jgi:serine/threonine-protein kinase
MMLQPGAHITERYRVVSVLARGGMGAVYDALDEKLGRPVAIKVLLPELLEEGVLVQRFEREALAAARLSHPGIVQVHDFGAMANGQRFIVMEKVAGKTVADLLERDGEVAPARAADIVEQTLGALGSAHAAGIVHRDLKPGNLMLVPVGVGSREHVKILDFGLAQLKTGTGYTRLTRTGALVGTPTFMAPEQAQGLPADARSDIYAMGVVLWCMLTGLRPFHGSDLAALVMSVIRDVPPRADAVAPGLPPALAGIAEQAMHKDPSRRFATTSAFAQALVDWRTSRAGSPPVRLSPEVRANGSARPAKRDEPSLSGVRRALPWVGLALAILFAGGAAIAAIGAIAWAVTSDGAATEQPPPATVNPATPPLGGSAAAHPCETAARCCGLLMEISAEQGNAVESASCDRLRELERYPTGAASCEQALASYRDALARVGRDPGVCDAVGP